MLPNGIAENNVCQPWWDKQIVPLTNQCSYTTVCTLFRKSTCKCFIVDSAFETRIESILTLKKLDSKDKVKTNVWLRIVCFPRFNWRLYSSWAEDSEELRIGFSLIYCKKNTTMIPWVSLMLNYREFSKKSMYSDIQTQRHFYIKWMLLFPIILYRSQWDTCKN